ncbi:MAG: response regulator [Bernardetiaceae bacterium]|jgi:CheY-like chemotaxis protein|nr:response regulator [Bernardetiaceae bacterium]
MLYPVSTVPITTSPTGLHMKALDKVFLVDDDPIFHFMAKKVINSTGLVNQLQLFNDAVAAFAQLKADAEHADRLPDLILVDLMMPVMDGWDFLKALQLLQLDKPVAVAVLTSSIHQTDMERAKASGQLAAYLVKPITPADFTALVESL